MKKVCWFFVGCFLLLLTACDGIKLTVENGNGSGTYSSGARVKIKAHLPNPGYEFDGWIGDTQYVEDTSLNETYMKLPELGKDEVLELKVAATYAMDPSAKEYKVEVENGSGSGNYLTYSVVTITANTAPDGHTFDKWVGDVEYLNSPYLPVQKVIVAKEDIRFEATYKIKVVPTVIPTVAPTPDPTPTQGGGTFSVAPIGESYEHGFFILRKFKNKLIAGAFGYSNKQKIFTYAPFAPAAPGFATSESVCDLREFDGYLYANTESQGQVWRTSDGNNWEKVLDVQPGIGCGLAVFNGYIYATELTLDSAPSEIYRSPDGKSWERVYTSGSGKRYLKELVVYQNKIYGFFVDLENNATGMLVSSDGKNWSKQSAPARFIRGYVFNNKIWLAGTKMYSASGDSTIYTYDGTTFKKMYSDSTKSHISYITSVGSMLVATTTVQWKGKQGGATLLQSCDGGTTWKTMYKFNETEAWGIEEFGGAVYVATKQDGGGGKVYKITGLCGSSEVSPTPTPSPTTTPDPGYVNLKECSQVEGFVWKLNKDGNTAIVNNKNYKNCSIKVNGKSPNVGGGVMDDGRPYWRFSGHPTQFKSPSYVETYCNGSVVVTVKIPNTGERCAYYPGGWGD